MSLIKLFAQAAIVAAVSFPLASEAAAHALTGIAVPEADISASQSASLRSAGHATLASNNRFDPSAPLGSAANPIPESSPTPASQAYRLVAGDPNLISNGPIPDTPANRARCGGPLSRAGRLSDPVGN